MLKEFHLNPQFGVLSETNLPNIILNITLKLQQEILISKSLYNNRYTKCMPIISFKHKIYICLRLIFFVIVTLLIKVIVKNISTNYNPLFTRCTFHIDTVINYTKGKETNRL